MTRFRLWLAALLALCGCGTVPPPPATTIPASKEPTAAVEAKPAPSVPAPSVAAPSAPPKSAAPRKPAATPVPPVPPVPPPPPVAKAPAKPAAAPLDLKSLEQRLKDTDAVGVLTKLSLKNQVDDLVAKFRAYHEGHQPPTLAELRRPFELLLMKVLSLLQDKDSALARDINASREAIWGVLSDRSEFAKSL